MMIYPRYRIPERGQLRCFALITLTFLLTASGYLSWFYHMLTLLPPRTADLLSMGAGYLLQALGMLLFAFLLQIRPRIIGQHLFAAVSAAFLICLVPAMLSNRIAAVILFGLLLNVCCGMLAGYYLLYLSRLTETGHTALVFGCGYAASTLLSWALSLIGGGSFLRAGSVFLLYIPLACSAVWLARDPDSGPQEKSARDPDHSDASKTHRIVSGDRSTVSDDRSTASVSSDPAAEHRLVLLVGVTVFLMCLVKNLGAFFPSADLGAGVSLELSRLLYGAGLIAAGLVSDRSRMYGAVCALAGLVTPFLMLTLAGESVPHIVLWCLDYFVFGFFSVYRVVVFTDLAARRRLLLLSGFGMMLGRAGDALGTMLSLLLAAHTTVLVLLTAALFAVTLVLFFRMVQFLYLPAAAKEKTERERFEHFASRHDLSAREREVLQQVVAGSTNAEIAQKLFVSESTVKFHVHNLLKKTGCRSRAQLRTALTHDSGE